MLTISKALTTGQAKDYFGEDYSNGESNYYSQGDTIKGEWFGQLAEEWGLKGEVKQEQFNRLVDGQDPHTGQQLIRNVKPYTYTNEYGEEVTTKGHRAAWDATFSAPKSVSLAALVGGDVRIRGAHRKAVDIALAELEKYIQAKMGNTKPSITTGRMVAAKFEHDTARPDKENRYAAPQLHTHTIIFNLTQLLGGKYRALDSTELFESQRYATAIYRAVLAIELQRLGYEIRVDGRTGAPEIVGFSKEYLEASSVRSKELRKEAAKMKARLEAEGNTVRDGAGLRQAAATANRLSKNFSREEMLERHQEMDKKHDGEAHKAVDAAYRRGSIEHAQEKIEKRAGEAVTFGIARLMDPEAVGDRRELFFHSLRRNMGLTTFEVVKQEIAGRETQGELIGILRKERMPEVTTRRMLDLERGNIREVLASRGRQQPIVEAAEVEQVIERISAGQGMTLNPSQREAVVQLLTNRDRIFGLQGLAGTGKTTVLSVLRAAAEEAGYTVKGFAPSTPAAKALSDSGIETTTLQKFTFSKRRANEATAGEEKRLFVLDESSLASTYHIHKFFDRVGPEDRIWLVGDKWQHLAVEAGSPFEQFQAHGMGTAKIARIIRQKEETLRKVVEKFAERKIRDAVRDLIAQGRVSEFADEKKRLHAMAADYCSKREETVVICPGNEERVGFNGMVHQRLQKAGTVAEEDHRTAVLVNRADMTKTERTFAAAYDPGDVIRYSHNSDIYGTRVGDYGQVVSRNYEENTITVRLSRDGREITYDPRRLSGVSVYVTAERDFAVGDRIQFRAPLAEQRIVNGEFGTIREIGDRGWKIELKNKRIVTIEPEKLRHIDHGYAVTSYSAQCGSFPRILFNADTRECAQLLNQRTGYVGISRAVLDARVYTDSIKRLAEALDRKQDKKTAVEAVEQSRQNRFSSKPDGKARRHQRQVAASAGRSQRRSSGRSAAGNGIAPDESTKSERPERRFPRGPRTFKKVVMQYQPQTTPSTQAMRKLDRVSRREPCPVCKKTNWCSLAADRSFAICMRQQSDHPAKSGWIHNLDESIHSRQSQPVPVEVNQHRRAEIRVRDEINRELLERLKLRDRDLKNLLARGLDEATIERNGYKSVPALSELGRVMEGFKDRDLAGIPGFFRKEGRWRLNIGLWEDKDGVQHSFHQGFLIPVRDIRGRIEGFQIRRADVTGDQPRYIWLSSNGKDDGTSSGAPVHYRNPERIRETGVAIITEGSLKADISAHLLNDRHAVIAVAGVNSFPDDFGARLKSQMPELRQVIIAFDADAGRKVEVQQALKRLNETLRDAGLNVRDLKWAEEKGKGLDDYLLKDPSHRVEVQDFLKGVAGADRQIRQSPSVRDRGISW